MHDRIPLLLLLSFPLASACFQQIDTGAARATLNPPPPLDPEHPSTVIETPDPLVTVIDGTTTETGDGCEGTTLQAMDILDHSCGFCHAAPASMASFDFVLNVKKMMNQPVKTATFIDPLTNKPWLYIVPGEPERSLIWVRMASGEMPQRPADVRAQQNLQYRIPTVSDFSLLHTWIKDCL